MGMKTSCILFVKNSVDSDIYRTKLVLIYMVAVVVLR
jgi:hypothetical protein